MNEQAYVSSPILKLFFKCTLPAMVGMGCGDCQESVENDSELSGKN